MYRILDSHRRSRLLAAAIGASLGAAIATPARADERRFGFVYEATTVPKGDIELEQWFTWKASTPEDHSFDRFEFRHEIEFGLTDHLQASLYLSDWHWQQGHSLDEDEKGFGWDDAAVELKYSFLDPTKDPFGLAAYGEVKIGDRLIELEGKGIIQKNFGKFVAAYNATIEAEFEERGYREHNGEFSQSVGLSYEITPRLLVGAEALHEIPLPGWHTGGAQTFYIGPNISYRAERWWTTATALAQATRASNEPEFQLRILFGVGF